MEPGEFDDSDDVLAAFLARQRAQGVPMDIPDDNWMDEQDE